MISTIFDHTFHMCHNSGFDDFQILVALNTDTALEV